MGVRPLERVEAGPSDGTDGAAGTAVAADGTDEEEFWRTAANWKEMRETEGRGGGGQVGGGAKQPVKTHLYLGKYRY